MCSHIFFVNLDLRSRFCMYCSFRRLIEVGLGSRTVQVEGEERMPMSPDDALVLIQEYGREENIFLTQHAIERMLERNVEMEDILRAIETATVCKHQEGSKWKVIGEDWFCDELTLIISIEGGNVVITLY